MLVNPTTQWSRRPIVAVGGRYRPPTRGVLECISVMMKFLCYVSGGATVAQIRDDESPQSTYGVPVGDKHDGIDHGTVDQATCHLGHRPWRHVEHK